MCCQPTAISHVKLMQQTRREKKMWEWREKDGRTGRVCVCVWCVCAFTAKSYKCVFCSDKDGWVCLLQLIVSVCAQVQVHLFIYLDVRLVWAFWSLFFFFFFFKSEKKHNIHCKGRIFLNLCQSYLLYMSVNIQSRKCNSCIAGTGVCRYLRRPNKLFLFQNHIQILGWDSDVSDDKLREKLKNN